MIPPLQSLVKYDNPVLVSTSKDKVKGGNKLGKKVRGLRLHGQGDTPCMLVPACTAVGQCAVLGESRA